MNEWVALTAVTVMGVLLAVALMIDQGWLRALAFALFAIVVVLSLQSGKGYGKPASPEK